MFYALLSGFIKGLLLVGIPVFLLMMLLGGKAWILVLGAAAWWLDHLAR